MWANNETVSCFQLRGCRHLPRKARFSIRRCPGCGKIKIDVKELGVDSFLFRPKSARPPRHRTSVRKTPHQISPYVMVQPGTRPRVAPRRRQHRSPLVAQPSWHGLIWRMRIHGRALSSSSNRNLGKIPKTSRYGGRNPAFPYSNIALSPSKQKES